MLDPGIQRKLESIRELPAIPFVISEVLNAIDNPKLSAAALASIIERDQSLTMRVLRMANSPFYGFARKISTIDLAIVVLGTDTIKEIVLTLIIRKLFSKARSGFFDVRQFWHYSVFCGAGARLIARKLGYRLAGEAFVAGLMHDVGVVIMVEYFPKLFIELRKFQRENQTSFNDAEIETFGSGHCEIGAWIAEKWNLPDRLCDAIRNHHGTFTQVAKESKIKGKENSNEPQMLTAIVAIAEWFSQASGTKTWAEEKVGSQLYLADRILQDIAKDDILGPESAVEMLRQEIIDSYKKASILTELV